MNTDNLIPIEFSLSTTPAVIGDLMFDVTTGVTCEVKSSNVKVFNDLTHDYKDWFVVSFASRTNTGEQPVEDDVVLDCFYEGEWITENANDSNWCLNEKECNPISKWKPNHAALLAKFKEQGANMNNFTKENTEDATHAKMVGGKIALYKKAENNNSCLDHMFFDTYLVRWSPSFIYRDYSKLIELSRPIGERKEDHTVNGVTKIAQPPGAKAHAVALMIEALDDNPDEVVNTDLHTAGGDGVSDLELTEFCGKLGVDGAASYKSTCEPQSDKPVFTQEMADAGEKIQVGMVFMSVDDDGEEEETLSESIVLNISETQDGSEVITFECDHGITIGCSWLNESFVKPIDNRSETEKINDEVYDAIRNCSHTAGWDVYIDAILSSDKFTISLK